MEEKISATGKPNYFFTIIKFFLFLIIICFLASINREFLRAIKAAHGLRLDIFFISILSAFAFYTFVVDLNNFYKKVQQFFFHGSFLAYLLPSFLILMGLGYFLIPKIFNVTFDRDTFVFLGGFVFTIHLIYIARDTRGTSFAGFINYLFNFSILYVVNLLFFILYLMAAFDKLHVFKIAVDGLKGGALLIQDIFSQIFR